MSGERRLSWKALREKKWIQGGFKRDLEPRTLGRGEAVAWEEERCRGRQKSGGISCSCTQSKSFPLKSSIKSILLLVLSRASGIVPRKAKKCQVLSPRGWREGAEWVAAKVRLLPGKESEEVCPQGQVGKWWGHGVPLQHLTGNWPWGSCSRNTPERLSGLPGPSSRTRLLGFGEGRPNI